MCPICKDEDHWFARDLSGRTTKNDPYIEKYRRLFSQEQFEHVFGIDWDKVI